MKPRSAPVGSPGACSRNAGFGIADGETGLAQLTSVESTSASAGQGTLTYRFSTSDPSRVTSISDESGRTVTFTVK